jgi:hypothetical protein
MDVLLRDAAASKANEAAPRLARAAKRDLSEISDSLAWRLGGYLAFF